MSPEIKLLLVDLDAETSQQALRKKALAGSVAASWDLGDVLICSCSDVTSGPAAAVTLCAWLRLTVVYCHLPRSICFLCRPNRATEETMAGLALNSRGLFANLRVGNSPKITGKRSSEPCPGGWKLGHRVDVGI